MYCSHCGNKINDGDLYCVKCGLDIETIVRVNKKRRLKTIKEVLLAIFIPIFIASAIGILSDYFTKKGNEKNAEKLLGSSTTVQSNQGNTKDPKVDATIKQFAENIRSSYNGEFNYISYSKYKVAKDGSQIYEIKYSTSYETIKGFQLVSLTSDKLSVNKSTKVYSFLVGYDGSLNGNMNQYSYEAEKLWGISRN